MIWRSVATATSFASTRRMPMPTAAAVWPTGTREDYDKAIADLDEAIRLEPKRGNLYRDRGSIYEQKGDKAKAAADFAKAKTLGRGPRMPGPPPGPPG